MRSFLFQKIKPMENYMTTQSKLAHRKRGFRWWAGCILIGGLVLMFLFGVVTWLAGALAKANLVKQYPAPGQLVDVGGYKMHIYCTGQGGPTVIMDAGNNDFSVVWALVQPDVAKFVRVCVYDRAGFGWSEPGLYPRTSETMVKELHTLLVNAKVEKPYLLVGHSFGGVNMRLYGQRYPDEVAGMVLVDSAHEEQMVRIPAIQKAVGQTVGQFRIFASMNSFGLLALSPENIPNRGLPDGALAQYRAILATTRYFETASAETEALGQSFAEVRAARITSLGNLPLIVLSRGLSYPLPGMSETENQQYEQAWQVMQSELVVLSSNSKQVIARQSGHYIQLQQPQLVIDAIYEIMQETQK
jgi:pimeloyl-ACP methyl ester carboxylesterase